MKEPGMFPAENEKEKHREKVIFIPGTTFSDRLFILAKEKININPGTSSGTVSVEEIKKKAKETLKKNPEIREKVQKNFPKNRFIANRGIESRLVAVKKLYNKLKESGDVEIYTVGGKEKNTVEDNLYRSEIVRNRLYEVYDIPLNSIISVRSSAANTEGNINSFLDMLKRRHDLTNTEVHVVTDERHLPRAVALLYFEAYKKLHGKNPDISEECIQQIIPILDRFKRFKDKDKLTAKETSKKILELLQALGGNIEITIIPESSADVIEENAEKESEKKYARKLKGDPYIYPKREDEIQGIIDLLSGKYQSGTS